MAYLGTDPEFFIIDGKGAHVPAHVVGIPENNTEIHYDHVYMPWGETRFISKKMVCPTKMHRDGMLLELNSPYGTCRVNLASYVKSALDALVSGSYHFKGEYDLLLEPAMEVDLSGIHSAPQDVQVFGCRPSYDAYLGVEKRMELDATQHPWRYAGAHLHISTGRLSYGLDKDFEWLETGSATFEAAKPNLRNMAMLVALADVYVGLPFTYLFGSKLMAERRKYYGQAGEFRPQRYGGSFSYGVEYRVLGPELWRHNALVGFAFGAYRTLFNNFMHYAKIYDPVHGQEVKAAINEGTSNPELLKLVRPLSGFVSTDILKGMKGWADGLPNKWSECSKGWAETLDNSWPEYVRNVTGKYIEHYTYHDRYIKAVA